MTIKVYLTTSVLHEVVHLQLIKHSTTKKLQLSQVILQHTVEEKIQLRLILISKIYFSTDRMAE